MRFRLLIVIFGFLIVGGLARAVEVQRSTTFTIDPVVLQTHLQILNTAVTTRNAIFLNPSATLADKARAQADFTRTVEQAKLGIGQAPVAAVCGNSLVEADEVCDTSAFGVSTCSSETSGARSSGALSCATDCHSINSSRCLAPTPPPPVCTVDTWSCTNWSACSAQGSQTGTCTLLNDCATVANQNPSPRACAPPLPTYILTLAKAGSGSGVVSSDIAGELGAGLSVRLNCGGVCSANFEQGRTVTLTAAPAAGSIFAGWSGGGCSGSGSCAVNMTAAQTVTATFNVSPAPFDFQISVQPASLNTIGGSLASTAVQITQISGTPAPVALSISGCPSGASCSFSPSSVTAPNSSFLFLNWPAALPSATGFFTITGAGGGVTKTQLVNFVINSSLTVSKSGFGAGAIASSPAGIFCGTGCSTQFPSRTNVTLTATPESGSVFGSWLGDCSGTSPSCTMSMNLNKTVTATFNPACVPTTCVAQGKNCGTISNGCGGTLNCGTCTLPQTCGGAGTANVCGAPAAQCGNNRIESREDCDGTNLGGKACPTGTQGTVRCVNCSFDLTGCAASAPSCVPDCSAAKLAQKTCGVTVDNGCGALCAAKGTQCTEVNTTCTIVDNTYACRAPVRRARCGNGVIEAGEVCDQANFGGRTCATATKGTRPSGFLECLSCTSISTSNCK